MKRIGSAPALIAGVAAIAAVLAISVAWGASGWFASPP